ncbi:MAG: hypothetical protein ABIH28_00395 [archaeon]
MGKAEEKQSKAEKEIELWLIHLDVDKFHYNRSLSIFVKKMTILIAVSIGLFSLFSLIISVIKTLYLSKLILIHVVVIILIMIIAIVIGVVFWGKKIKKEYDGQIGGHKGDVTRRITMIDDMYRKLGVDKDDKLKKEFGSMKK